MEGNVFARFRLTILCLISLAGVVSPLAAQSVLERSPNMSGGWVGYPGTLFVNLPHRLATVERAGADVVSLPTFEFGLGLPRQLLTGVRFAPESPLVPGRPNEWEIFGRFAPVAQARGGPADVALSVGFNGAAESADGELSLARWFGPLRLLGAARALSAPYGGDQARLAVAGGAVVHPRPGGLPIALAGDVGTLLDPEPGEELAWSAALQIGLSFTTHTLSLFATNTSTATIQGVSRGDDRVRYGFELTLPIPAGRFLGWFVPREQAAEAVVEEPEDAERLVRADIARYFFAPKRLEVPAGTTIEWTNVDDVVHTVSADDGSWGSGAIPPGERWRATYNRPGTYPYHCGPHPFMKGVVVVR